MFQAAEYTVLFNCSAIDPQCSQFSNHTAFTTRICDTPLLQTRQQDQAAQANHSSHWLSSLTHTKNTLTPLIRTRGVYPAWHTRWVWKGAGWDMAGVVREGRQRAGIQQKQHRTAFTLDLRHHLADGEPLKPWSIHNTDCSSWAHAWNLSRPLLAYSPIVPDSRSPETFRISFHLSLLVDIACQKAKLFQE